MLKAGLLFCFCGCLGLRCLSLGVLTGAEVFSFDVSLSHHSQSVRVKV